MPKLDPRVISLRNTTLEAIERLMDSGHFQSYISAARHFHVLALERKAAIGFNRGSFQRFYYQIKYWRRSPQSRQSSPNLTEEDLGMCL